MVRYKFVHFNKRSDFDSYVPNPESNSANGNEYYNYVVFIKDTKEIYTHGQFYNCSDSGDSSIDEILEELKSSINSKADLSSLEALIKEVEENEEVTAAALTELHENKADKSEIPDVSNLVTKNEFNILSAEVEEKVDSTIFTTLSETVAGHTTNINNLSDNKADKTDLEDYAKKDDLNTKQDQLVSGTTIKTVNGNSILGSGNIETPDTKVTSADNHYGYDANNAISTTGAFVTKITKDAANHVTSFESRALISTDIPELDASKITSGEISIDRLPKGALERLFVVESEAAAISATVQEGDVVQVTGNNNKMYFCISNTATTFATKFKEFTAGTATSIPWSGITGKPTGIDGWGDRIGVIESGYATQSWVGENYLSVNGTAQSALKMTPEYLTDLNSATPWRFFDMKTGYGSADGNKPDIAWVSGITGTASGSSNYRWQLAMTTGSQNPYFRREHNGNWNNWSTLAFTSNIPTRLSQLTDDVVAGKYLPLSGGTLTGQDEILALKSTNSSSYIAFDYNNTRKATVGVYNGLAYIANETIGTCPRIGVNDSGIPQYWDGYEGKNKYTLLHSGNYSDLLANGTINGTITAPSFIGNLTGNADSAGNADRVGGYGEDSFVRWRGYTPLSDIDNISKNGVYYGNNLSVIDGAFSYGTLVSLQADEEWTEARIAQMYFSDRNKLYVRSKYTNAWDGHDWKEVAFTDSNVASATKLATPRTIWGQSFDGTGDINGAIDVSLVASALDIPVIKFASDCYFDRYGNYVFGESAGSFSVFNGSHLNAIFHVLKTGNVAIGAKTADEKLHVYGNVKASGSMYAVDFATTSDNRLKDFVSDIYVDFESIKQIPKKYYYWKDKSMGEDLQIGTSAQELAKIYPECVHYDETNDRYSVNYQKLSIVALAAIDKLHDRVSELESKLYDKNN